MNIRNLETGLNPPQLEAVRQIDGPLLVFAGAGSGKTKVITHRIGYMLSRDIPPTHILAVTFTNKAADEMKKRIGTLCREIKPRELTVNTFHAFGVKILRRYIHHLNYKTNFCIYTEQERRSLLKKILNQDFRGIGGSFLQAAEITISHWKNAMLLPPDITEKEMKNEQGFMISEIYKRYQTALQSLNALDFDDLILLTATLWRISPQALQECQQRYRYIMVDEFQDTNAAQYTLLRQLTQMQQNICVVGDDDQSIYSWRGADIANILNFEKDYPGTRTIRLEQNYRSTQTILDAANSLIANNPTRAEKKLWSNKGTGYQLDSFQVIDENREAELVADKILQIRQSLQMSFNQFAVLYRSNAQSRNFEMEFRKKKIPYLILGGQNFFDRKEVKDIVAYLNVILNPDDDINLLRIINCPRRGIGENSLIKIIGLSHQHNRPIFDILKHHLNTADLSPTNRKSINEFLWLLDEYRYHFLHSDRKSDTLARFLEVINYKRELQVLYKQDDQIEARWQNVQEVINALGKAEDDNPDMELPEFIDQISLGDEESLYDKDKEQKEASSVRLMTFHSAKGMEFPFVFMVGMEEKIFPHEKAIQDRSLEEERRLCYVGITRAQQHLILVHTRQRYRNGKPMMSVPSRFYKEIPPHLINRRIMNESLS
ncbi:MAG: UvrD-helicase domain-containing protein [Candidatus Delongbacteria bacterium]|nr:UvrD-helicase domain-containing protein [Candidatus Delongbacteria bacterium]